MTIMILAVEREKSRERRRHESGVPEEAECCALP